MMCTGMCRVCGWCLSRSSTAQPSIPGMSMSSVIASGSNACASSSPASPSSATSPLNPFSRAISSSIFAKFGSFSMMSSVRSPGSIASRSSSKPSGRGSESRDISTSCSSAPYDGATAVAPPDSPQSPPRRCGQTAPPRLTPGVNARPAPLGRPRLAPTPIAGVAPARRAAFVARRFRIDVPGGQEERERAPAARRALHADLAAEQARDLAADRQSEPGAAELAARRPVGLLERLEDELLLVLRDPDPGVAHGERDHRLRLVERSGSRTASPSPPCGS